MTMHDIRYEIYCLLYTVHYTIKRTHALQQFCIWYADTNLQYKAFKKLKKDKLKNAEDR